MWGYFSVKGGGAVHEYSDSQFGHLFAKGENRDAAIHAMVVALKARCARVCTMARHACAQSHGALYASWLRREG